MSPIALALLPFALMAVGAVGIFFCIVTFVPNQLRKPEGQLTLEEAQRVQNVRHKDVAQGMVTLAKSQMNISKQITAVGQRVEEIAENTGLLREIEEERYPWKKK